MRLCQKSRRRALTQTHKPSVTVPAALAAHVQTEMMRGPACASVTAPHKLGELRWLRWQPTPRWR